MRRKTSVHVRVLLLRRVSRSLLIREGRLRYSIDAVGVAGMRWIHSGRRLRRILHLRVHPCEARRNSLRDYGNTGNTENRLYATRFG